MHTLPFPDPTWRDYIGFFLLLSCGLFDLISKKVLSLGIIVDQMYNISLIGWIGYLWTYLFQKLFPTIEILHLIRTGSDHAPLLMLSGKEATLFVKPFKFINFWTQHESFKNMLMQNWVVDFVGDPFIMFKQKLKKVKGALSK